MQIDVVSERRLYAPWTGVAPSDEARARLDYVTASSGIIPVKRVLNQLHQFLGENGYNEVRYHLQSAPLHMIDLSAERVDCTLIVSVPRRMQIEALMIMIMIMNEIRSRAALE